MLEMTKLGKEEDDEAISCIFEEKWELGEMKKMMNSDVGRSARKCFLL